MKLLFFIVMIAMAATGHAQSNDQFILQGKVAGQHDGYVYLSYTGKNGRVLDSAALKNGSFRFTGNISEPTLASFWGKTTNRGTDDPNFTSIFIEPATMELTATANAFKLAKLTGSKTQSEYEPFQLRLEKIRQRWKVVMDTLSAANKRSNFEYQALRSWALKPYFAEMREMDLEFINKHPESFATAYRLRFLVNDLTEDSLGLLYNRFPQKVKESYWGKAIADELRRKKVGVTGSTASVFSATDINGAKVSLADYKGKYVLLDFWASWCLPCRKLNPHLKELYAKYKDKGFEIIGVSDDDRNPAAWKKAVADDGLPWKHVLRGMKIVNGVPDRSADINEGYNISSLPTHILIDPTGKIIGRYGEDPGASASLDKMLESVFKQ
ncbi:MAG TPA: TlpA disulfide reductase family protein [Chitinophagaceae bacterium]